MFELPDDVLQFLIDEEVDDYDIENIQSHDKMLEMLWDYDNILLYKKYYQSNISVLNSSIDRFTREEGFDFDKWSRDLEEKWIELFIEKEEKITIIKIMKKNGLNYKEYYE